MRNPYEIKVRRNVQIAAARGILAEANLRLQVIPPPADGEILEIMQKMGDAYYRLGLVAGVYKLDSEQQGFLRPDPILDGRKIVTITPTTNESTDSNGIHWQEPRRIPGAPDRPAPLPYSHREDTAHTSTPPTEATHKKPGKDFRSTTSDPKIGQKVIDALDRDEQEFKPISRPGLFRLIRVIETTDPVLLKRIELDLTPERLAQFAAIKTLLTKKDPEIETKLTKATGDVVRRITEFLKDPMQYLKRCTNPNEAQLLMLLASLSVKPVTRAQFITHATNIE